MIANLWHDSRLMSLLAGFISLLAVGMIAAAAVNWLIHRPMFDLKTLVLKGEAGQVNLIGFETQVLPHVGGSFFSVDLREVRELVESQPWVRKAAVQRAWPNALNVIVEAHKPLALWGDARLVNTYGEIFSANVAEAMEQGDLARLEGPSGSEALVSKMYVNASHSLAGLDLVPVAVNLSDRFGWTFELQNGVRLELGREQEEVGIEDKLARLKRVYSTLATQVMRTIEVIDMRYPRGLAVQGERLPQSAAG